MRLETRAIANAARAFLAGVRSKREDEPAGIGLALGGGFSRGMAHIGVLRVFEREGIPVRSIAGVSAGSIVAAAVAGGADSHHLEAVGRVMRFRDVASWKLSRLGLVGSERMTPFLRRVLPVHRFEDMPIPLAVVATDLQNGESVIFQSKGEVFPAVRASCAYPGLFLPLRHEKRVLVDGAISMEIPAEALRMMGVKRVVSVMLPPPLISAEPKSMFMVVSRSFQIMQRRTEQSWRQFSDVVITPEVGPVAWDDFSQLDRLIQAGMRAAEAALPAIRKLLPKPGVTGLVAPVRATA